MYRSHESWIILTATLVLILQYYFVLTTNHVLFFVSAFLYFLVIPASLISILGARLRECGFIWRTWPYSLGRSTLAAAVLVLMTAALALPPSRDYYVERLPLAHLPLLVVLLGLYCFGEEFFFRGFLLQQLRRRFGEFAIILQAMPFALFHIAKPPLEVVESLFVGLLFGHVAYRTNSFLPTFLIHWALASLLSWLVTL